MRLIWALFVAVGALALAPALAQASQLRVTAGTLFYLDTDQSAKNVVTFKLSTDQKSFVVTETGRTGTKTIQITSDGSCTISRGVGTCPVAGVSSLDIETGPGDDTATVSVATPARLLGGDGNDKLTGGSGDDTLIGGTGSDTLNGGAGRDTADYSDRTAPLNVTLDGTANDGEAGENDNVGTDVEAVLGGAGDDTLVGDGDDNGLNGGPGNDTLSGGDGNDRLTGGPGDDKLDGAGGDDIDDAGDGNDQLSGGAGNDQLTGGPGDDLLDGGAGADSLVGDDGSDTATYADSPTGVRVSLDGLPGDGAPGENDNVDTENLIGSPGDDVLIGNAGPNLIQGGDGNDRLVGGKGPDTLDGGAGDDLIESLNGVVDRVVCGDGGDGVVGDKADVRSDCELIKYRILSASSTALHLSHGTVRIPARCQPGAATVCRGRIAVEYRGRVLGTRKFQLPAGRRWVAKIALSRRGRALVAKHRLLTASLVVRTFDDAGAAAKTRQTIRIGA